MKLYKPEEVFGKKVQLDSEIGLGMYYIFNSIDTYGNINGIRYKSIYDSNGICIIRSELNIKRWCLVDEEVHICGLVCSCNAREAITF